MSVTHLEDDTSLTFARRAAAGIYLTEPERIGLELDETDPAVPRIVVNFQESQKVDRETRTAVIAAVKALLPDNYAHCKVTTV